MADVGISLIGHAFKVFGIGEDVRLAARGLQRSRRRPLCLHLVCQASPVRTRWLRQKGCEPLRERYTLSSWPWETQQWPEAWMPLLQVTDELWPSSRFTAAALAGPAAEAGLPLQVMPMAAEITEPERFCSAAARAAARARHGLPGEAVLFGYGFDLNSTAIRKNPMAALEAFQLAFPQPHLPATYGRDCNHHPLSGQVALLIKTFPPQDFSAEWHWLQARAAGLTESRISPPPQCRFRSS